jgi:hypothetical protein
LRLRLTEQSCAARLGHRRAVAIHAKRLRGDAGGLVASVVGVQPSVEHADHIIETVTAADRYESLAAANSAGAS